jgi:hypothetical protein
LCPRSYRILDLLQDPTPFLRTVQAGDGWGDTGHPSSIQCHNYVRLEGGDSCMAMVMFSSVMGCVWRVKYEIQACPHPTHIS